MQNSSLFDWKGWNILESQIIGYRDEIEAELTELRTELATRGMFVRVGKKFDTLARQVSSTSGRAPLHEQFDPSGDMDGAVDAFWVCGFDEDGELVHTQAAHLLDLRGSSISAHIISNLVNYSPASPPVTKSSITATAGPKGSSIGGMVGYHGEMWLRADYRDQGTAAIVIRLGILLIAREWDPDAVFGLMNWALACRGFNMRIGYSHCEPMTLSWRRTDTGAQHQVWLVYLERDDIAFLMNLPVLTFSRALTKQFA